MILIALEYTVYLLLFYLLYICIFQKEISYQVNRFYLLLSLPISYLLIQLPRYQVNQISSELFQFTLPTIWVGSTPNNEVVFAESSTLNMDQIFLVVLSIGMLIAMSRFLFSLYRIHRIYESSWTDEVDGVPIRMHPLPLPPFSFLNQIYLFERHSYSQQEMRLIIRHEQEHIRQRHSWDNIILEILGILLWWNPVFYLIRREIKNIHEYQADQKVVGESALQDYGQFLIDQLEVRQVPILAHPLFSHPMLNRIKMMKKLKMKSMNYIKYLWMLPVLIMMIAIHGCSEDAVSDEADIFPNKESKKMDNSSSKMEVIDTIITFDPETKKEEVKIVRNEEDVYRVVEKMPVFPGCDEKELSGQELTECSNRKMLEYIYQNIKYPQKAKMNDVEGKVVVQFVVHQTGQVVKPKLIQDIGHGTGEEVMRVIRKMMNDDVRWSPGRQKNKSVNVLFTLPVKFKLQ